MGQNMVCLNISTRTLVNFLRMTARVLARQLQEVNYALKYSFGMILGSIMNTCKCHNTNMVQCSVYSNISRLYEKKDKKPKLKISLINLCKFRLSVFFLIKFDLSDFTRKRTEPLIFQEFVGNTLSYGSILFLVNSKLYENPILYKKKDRKPKLKILLINL